jgi:hypothetical protein
MRSLHWVGPQAVAVTLLPMSSSAVTGFSAIAACLR